MSEAHGLVAASLPLRRETTATHRLAAEDEFRGRALAFGLAVAALPFLRPNGPANISPADVGVAVAVVGILLSAGYAQVPLRVPYLMSVTGLLVAGTLSAMLSQAPVLAGLALIQDVFLLAWAAAIANAGRDPRLLQVILRVWAVTATVCAALVTVGMITDVSQLAGREDSEGFRASFTLGDPNVAGNFFLVSLFVLRATAWPTSRVRRWPMCLLLLLGIAFSGSNGAMLGLVVATGLGLLLGIRRKRGMVATVAVAAVLSLAALLMAPHVHPATIQHHAADSVALLRDGIGRSDQSSDERVKLAAESVGLLLHGSLVGVGPAQTKDALARSQAPYVKEAHDDYLATFVERGLLGAVGLVLLVATVAVRVTRVAFGGLQPGYASLVPRPELLICALVVMAVAGLFYEVLHFRHLWAVLGVVAALDLWGRRE